VFLFYIFNFSGWPNAARISASRYLTRKTRSKTDDSRSGIGCRRNQSILENSKTFLPNQPGRRTCRHLRIVVCCYIRTRKRESHALDKVQVCRGDNGPQQLGGILASLLLSCSLVTSLQISFGRVFHRVGLCSHVLQRRKRLQHGLCCWPVHMEKLWESREILQVRAGVPLPYQRVAALVPRFTRRVFRCRISDGQGQI
jgi:hypothetical protein